MANATPSRLGQVNNSGDTQALFLKVFAGEVLTAFTLKCVMADRQMVRTITAGKSAQFPVLGRIATASYHTPGVEITGDALPASERVITIDDMLLSSAFIAAIDEAKNHYDVRATYSSEMGKQLANSYDRNVAQVKILAARASGLVSGDPSGYQIQNAAMATDSEVLAASIYRAAQNFDEKDVDADMRTAFLRPAQYYLLAQSTKVVNKDWGGAGSYSDGKVLRVAGIEIVETNNLPSTVVSTGPSAYQGDFTKTVGVITRNEASGTVKLLDLALESEYDIRRQGTLFVAKYAVGHGILRPAAAVELATP